jgi:hypothetical protein
MVLLVSHAMAGSLLLAMSQMQSSQLVGGWSTAVLGFIRLGPWLRHAVSPRITQPLKIKLIEVTVIKESVD